MHILLRAIRWMQFDVYLKLSSVNIKLRTLCNESIGSWQVENPEA